MVLIWADTWIPKQFSGSECWIRMWPRHWCLARLWEQQSTACKQPVTSSSICDIYHQLQIFFFRIYILSISSTTFNFFAMSPKRKRSNDAPDQGQTTRRKKQYAHLKPQVRHISERTIKSKWSTLPEPTQDKIRDMFRALERPVIVRQQNDRKRYEAQAAVQAVVKKYVPTRAISCGYVSNYYVAAIVLESDYLGCLFLRWRKIRFSSTKRPLRSTYVCVLLSSIVRECWLAWLERAWVFALDNEW